MLRLLITTAVLNALLLALEIPRHSAFGPTWLALEAPALAGLFALLPVRRWRGWLGWLAGGLFAALTLLTLADALTRYSLARPVNLYLDLPLVSAVCRLMAGIVTPPAAIAGMIGGVAALVGLAALIHWLLTGIRGVRPHRAYRLTAIALLLIGGIGIANDRSLPGVPGATTPGLTLAMDQQRRALRTHAESRDFAAMLSSDLAPPAGSRLVGLAGIDVTMGFIESYGVSAIFDERYAPTIRPRLKELEQRLAAAGLHMVTGTLNAPIFGGQSWLAHGTLLSGLWLNNQIRYDLLLASDLETLVDDFRRTGHDTVAVMPAITEPWPEGRRLSYDRIFAKADIDYAGPPFNWVTMPDQYTWWFFENRIRAKSSAPVFAELALISSHAPWVPVLPVIEDWQSIGDGAIFQQWEGLGEAPEVLWRDHDRVREQYALSVAYALAVVTGYAEQYVNDRTLLIVLGDHQPAPLITGHNASAAVPVHVISADPALIEPFLKYGFRPGALPDSARTNNTMDAFRGWLHAAFGDGDGRRQ
ncbi:MAG: hypothetical protein WED00_14030 [Aquisalimonadaceae bacterium]